MENNFKGFFAGINYQKPARTYFRDGYWTILSVLPFFPELVRNEIITLANGIHEDGTCPSGVICSGKVRDFWSDHYDSPLFFIMMVYDYICFSGDVDVLYEKINEKKIIDLMELCIGRFINEDEGEMLISKPPFCRRDWVDNVYRSGYTTYIEVLYARSLYCMGSIYTSINDIGKNKFMSLFERCKNSINKHLWDDKKGYYINYANGDRIEDNLSIDTILAILYNIADDDKKNSVLDRCEELLETKNNKEQKYGDWGVMCAYPFYKHKNDLVEKSNFEYRYHNGSDWPYLDGVYALTKLRCGRNAEYALSRWFDYSIEHSWFTPVEYYNPVYGKGSYLQAWSAMPAAAIVMGGFNFIPDIEGNVNIINRDMNCVISNVKLRGKVLQLK
jgi:glycogen debranching enzyme